MVRSGSRTDVTGLPSREMEGFYLLWVTEGGMGSKSWKQRAEELESEVYALYLASRDDRTPIAAKGVIALTVAFAVSPIDPIPDFVPVLGYVDDLLFIPLGVGLALRLVPADILAECRTRADEEMDVGKARRIGAVLTVLVWVVLAILLVRALA